MAIVAIRGHSFGQYLKDGYNVVRRYQKGEEPDDKEDCFEHLGKCKTKKEAEKKAKPLKGKIEIVAHGIKKEPR